MSSVDCGLRPQLSPAALDQRLPRYTSYPPATSFSPAIGAADYEEWLRALPADAPVSVYVHIPFCAELCLYCGCNTTVARKYAPLRDYVDVLAREVDLVAELLGDVRPASHMHWGGGTPTILPAADMRSLVDLLNRRFRLTAGAEVAIEIDPRTTNRDQIRFLAQIGFNRFSLGVQDFNPDVQRAINRRQSFVETSNVAQWARDAGIASINLDLIYGLPHQTTASVIQSTRQALELRPDRIAVFGYAHVPWMKKHQRLIPETSLPGPVARLEQCQAMSETILAAGYVAIGLDHFARAEDGMAAEQRAGRLHRNFQGYTTDGASTLIGFGASSIGSLPQGYVQNAADTPGWRDAIMAGRLATARGVRLSGEDVLRRAVIERLMCDLTVDLAAVSRAHGAGPEHFAHELLAIGALEAEGMARRNSWTITIPEEARPFVRRACAVFDQHLREGPERHSKVV